MIRIWNYIRGYVIIIVKGRFVEKFINICTRRQILLCDIRSTGAYEARMQLSIKDFRRIRPVTRKSRCRVVIDEKRGLPFLLYRYRKRKTFAAGIILFIVVFNLLAMFVWDIEIMGTEKEINGRVKTVLQRMGISQGIIKYGIDTQRVANSLMLEVDELSWCGVELKGTRLLIHTSIRAKPPQIVPDDQPCNILAGNDGFIEFMVVKRGQEKVRPGDIVKKGQLLVSGIVENSRQEGEIMLVHAIAEIKARTWYEGEAEAGTFIIEKIPTGRKKNIYYVDILGRRIKIPSGMPGYENFSKSESEWKVQIGKNMVLPLGIAVNTYEEYIDQQREVTTEKARMIAGDNAYRRVLKGIPQTAQIIETDVVFEEGENASIKATVVIECLEDIGIEKRIGGK